MYIFVASSVSIKRNCPNFPESIWKINCILYELYHSVNSVLVTITLTCTYCMIKMAAVKRRKGHGMIEYQKRVKRNFI